MKRLDVYYNGKDYVFTGYSSIALVDILQREFGPVIRDHASELYSEYWTAKGAHAYIY